MKDEKWKSFTETMDVRALKNVTPLSMSWPIAMGKHCDLHRVEEGIVEHEVSSYADESRGRSRQESTESGRCVGKVSLEFVTARKVQVIQNEKGPKYKKLKIFSKRGQFRNIANPAENSTPRPRTQTCGATKRFSREGGREARTSEKGTKHVYGWIRLRFRE